MKKLFVALALIIILSGCMEDSVIPTTPIRNTNHTLQHPVQFPENPNDVRQDSFENYGVYSVNLDVDGNGPDVLGSTGTHAYMQAFVGNLEIFIQGAAGSWGLEQDLILDEGWYMLILVGHTDIEDRYHPEFYVISGNVYFPDTYDTVQFGAQNIPLHGHVEAVFGFHVEYTRPVVVRGYYQAYYGRAGENSVVNLYEFKIIKIDDPVASDLSNNSS